LPIPPVWTFAAVSSPPPSVLFPLSFLPPPLINTTPCLTIICTASFLHSITPLPRKKPPHALSAAIMERFRLQKWRLINKKQTSKTFCVHTNEVTYCLVTVKPWTNMSGHKAKGHHQKPKWVDRRETNNGLVLEGVHPNRKQKDIARRQSKSGEMRDGQETCAWRIHPNRKQKAIVESWSESGEMRDRQRTHGVGQKMNNENLNGWKCLDEKGWGWKKILSWVSARGPVRVYRGYWFLLKWYPANRVNTHRCHKS